jgi:hypothetical protein
MALFILEDPEREIPRRRFFSRGVYRRQASGSTLPAVADTDTSLPFLTRLWFAWVCFFRVLFDGSFAAKVFALRSSAPELPPARSEQPAGTASLDVAALQLLALLQREGRLIDFLQQDIVSFGDAEIGAAARVVHEGCRKALSSHVKIQPVRSEAEGGRVTLERFDPAEIKLIGNVGGDAPYRGVLRHRGWRVESVELPKLLEGHDGRVLAPAEVEL